MSGNTFGFLGVPAALGRTLLPEDARPGAPPVFVMSHKLWAGRFGGDPGLLGRSLVLNGVPTTLVGIMPPRFTKQAADLYKPIVIDRADPELRQRFFMLQGRLKPGVTLEQAEAEIGLLLFIACANLANLLLARVTAREREMASSVKEPRAMMWLFAAFAACVLLLAAIGTYGVASYSAAQRTYEIGVRVAIGATRGDILGLVIGQSLRLVSLGLGAGVVAALLLGRTLSSFLYGVSAKDPVTFAVVVLLLIATALLAGYVPGRRAAATDVVRALRAD